MAFVYFWFCWIILSSGYTAAWDSDDFELFDLVEEINQNFYDVLGVTNVRTLHRALPRLFLVGVVASSAITYILYSSYHRRWGANRMEVPRASGLSKMCCV